MLLTNQKTSDKFEPERAQLISQVLLIEQKDYHSSHQKHHLVSPNLFLGASHLIITQLQMLIT